MTITAMERHIKVCRDLAEGLRRMAVVHVEVPERDIRERLLLQAIIADLCADLIKAEDTPVLVPTRRSRRSAA